MQKIEIHLTSPWLTLAILSSLGIIAMVAETMILPAISDIIHELGISYENSSWILASILSHGGIFSITSVVSLVLFVRIEKNTNFPLIDFKILNKMILYANIINMTVGLTALIVVYQTLPILIRSHPPAGFGG